MRIFQVYIFLMMAVLSIVVFNGCKKESPDDNGQIPPVDEVPMAMEQGDSTEAALLEAFLQVPDTAIAIEDMQLSTGEFVEDILNQWDPDFLNQYRTMSTDEEVNMPYPAEEQKQILLAHLLVLANYLCDDTKHIASADTSINAPDQNGLAYSFGSKDWSFRQRPNTLGGGSTCDHSIYGLDCSGFMMSILRPLGLHFCSGCVGVIHQRETATWNDMFSASSNYDSLEVVDKGDLPLTDLQTGDIITWFGNGAHIGIILEHQGNKYLYNSLGRPSACTTNIDSDHGPRTFLLTQNALNVNAGQRRVLRIQPIANTVTDIDGNVYPIVTIGNQVWMAENLRTTRYNNGEAILSDFDDASWLLTTDGAWAYPDGDIINDGLLGKLYNFYAVVDARHICPTGWHVPSNAEWDVMINFLDPNADGGASFPNVSGGKIKSTGTIEAGTGLWSEPNEGANNSSGFSGHPAGVRDGDDGGFRSFGSHGRWWTSTEYQDIALTLAWNKYFAYDVEDAVGLQDKKQYGFSVRCIRD